MANGGIIKLSAATAKYLSRASVNIGSSGMIVARSVNEKSGKVVIGSPIEDNIKIAGKIDVSGHKSQSPQVLLLSKEKMYPILERFLPKVDLAERSI